MEGNQFCWRPFQIAFILMNLKGITDPLSNDRNIVDLLYFPTGGGKTEAYLGLIAFVIAYRRLNIDTNDGYNRDGGVTAILRYTLRLLTAQQRDRLTKMIIAAEMERQRQLPKFGREPITIGFWVGGGVSVDGTQSLISSANLSYHGMMGNIELGCHIESTRIAKEIDEAFKQLLFQKVFRRV